MMHTLKIAALFMLAATLSGCDKTPTQEQVESEQVEQTLPTSLSNGVPIISAVEAVSESSENRLNQEIDAKLLAKGRILFIQCAACHSLGQDGENKIGPSLYALFGAAAATKQDFTYSNELISSGITWDDQSLDRFLLKPADYVPGTTMVFAGLTKQEDRLAVIAYMKSVTAE